MKQPQSYPGAAARRWHSAQTGVHRSCVKAFFWPVSCCSANLYSTRVDEKNVGTFSEQACVHWAIYQVGPVHFLRAMAETAIEEALARKIAQLQPTSPEIIRAAPAYRALQRFGAALRPKSNFLNANSTYLSQPTTRINAFWSHSWHGGTTRKICTLLMLHNSGPAALLSVLAALLAAWAFGFGLLPELVHPYLVWWIPRALWPFITGMVVFWMTLLLWQPRDSIFLDSLCIDQIDMHAKAQGLFSMGAFLKCSKKLLVLWDPTYTRRLGLCQIISSP